MLFFKREADASLEQLIEQAKNGNINSFGKVYDSLVEKVYRFIFFKVESRETAEDLTQGVFLKALENIEKYRKNTSFLAWIYTIARNSVIDHYRTKKQKVSLEVASKIEFIDKELDLESKESTQTLYQALRALSHEEREVVELHSVDDYSFEEIAQVMGKAPGALRILKYRALTKLRKLLK
ncbi:MAG TPA: RNA polymerase sigma factor [Candidatus Nanoarchaeia archaeon]|nr:ECF RNA polymerase sigma factor SigW [uncultured archaeon]